MLLKLFTIHTFYSWEGLKTNGETYIVISCIILQAFVFHLYYSVNNLPYEVSVMRNSNDSALVLRYSLLFEHDKISRTKSFSLCKQCT